MVVVKRACVYGRLRRQDWLGYIERRIHAKDVRFEPKVGQIGPNWRIL